MFVAIGILWFVIALVAAASGVTEELEPPLPQLVLLGLTAALLLAPYLVPGFRKWLYAIRWESILKFHLVRFVGVYFLLLFYYGALPYEFAVPGGIGDIVVALAALVLLRKWSGKAIPPLTLLLWNAVGFVDILFVVYTAARLALMNADSMQALLRLPLSLLPTFIVPIIIASHLLIFVRLGTRTIVRAEGSAA